MNTDDTQLLHDFAITRVLECIADPARRRIFAHFSDDVSPAFPYLNAVIPRLSYNPGANALSIKRGYRLLTIYPNAATLAKVEGLADAEEQLRWFQTQCNDVWLRRSTITPIYEPRRTADPIDVYQLLPQLNCHECGQATCWAFSWELVFGDQSLDSCPPLSTDAYAQVRLQLQSLLA